MSALPPRSFLKVMPARPREHYPRILELEQAASADRIHLYDGFPWTNDAFREYLRKGVVLVVLSKDKNVVGFACYHLTLTGIEVVKLVAPCSLAEESLLLEIYAIQARMHKTQVNLPMILSFTG